MGGTMVTGFLSPGMEGKNSFLSVDELQGQRETWRNVRNVLEMFRTRMLGEPHGKPTCDCRYNNLKGQEMGLREASWPKSQSMNWEMFWRQAWGFLLSPHPESMASSLGPLAGSPLLHQGTHGSPQESSGSSPALAPPPSCCLVFRNHLPLAALASPSVKWGLNFVTAQPLTAYPGKPLWLMINEIMVAGVVPQSRPIYYGAESIFLLPFKHW